MSDTRFVSPSVLSYEKISGGAKVTRHNLIVNLALVTDFDKIDNIEYDNDRSYNHITDSERFGIRFFFMNRDYRQWVFPTRELRDHNFDRLLDGNLSIRIKPAENK